MIQLHKAILTIDNTSPVYIGYIAPNQYWNGWLLPHFELPEATAVATDYNDTAEFPMHYDPIYDQFYTWDSGNDDYYIIKGRDYHTADGIKHLYNIGAGCWVWDKVTPSQAHFVAQQVEELLADAEYDYNSLTTDLSTLAQIINILRADDPTTKLKMLLKKKGH